MNFKPYFNFLVSITTFLPICANADEIRIGQSAALSGPAAALGKGMRLGAEAWFAEFNAQGGHQGDKIRLISVDDRYEPEGAVQNTKNLIEKEKVSLLFGYVGTPTSKEAIPVAEKAGIPYIAAFTGAELLRTPFRRYVVNFRASYYQETEKIVEHLVTDLGIKKIAVFRQDDSYGEAGRDGVIKALEKRKLQLTAEGKYKRNTIQIQEGFNSIDSTSPEAVVMVGAYKPCAEFMKKVKAEKKNWKIINISFVGASALAALAGDSAENTIVSQVVPSPWNDSIPIVAEYQKNLKKFEKNAEFDFISLESYAAAKMLTKVISSIEKPITSEKFIAAAEKLSKFEIDGLPLSLSPSVRSQNI